MKGSNVSFAEKIWRSKADEYVILKLLINIPVGLLLGVGYYYGAVHRLELRKEVDMVVGAGMVTLIMLGFTISKQVRCTTLLILPTMFTKEGRFWISTLTYGALLTGPIQNVILNSEEIMRTVSCSMEFLAKQHSEKLLLLGGPLQAFSRKVGINMQDFDRGVKQFVSSISPEAFSISGKIGGVELGNEAMTAEQAEYAVDWTAEDDEEKSENRYRKNKNKVQLMKQTMNQDCLEMVSSAEKKCVDAVKEETDKCWKNGRYAMNIIDFRYIVCKEMDKVHQQCLNTISVEELASQCNPESAISPGFEESFSSHDQAMSSQGLSEDVSVNVEEIIYERKVNQTSRSDVSEGIKNEFVYKRQILEFITLTLKRLMVFAFVLVVRRAWKYNSKYRTDLMYDNTYVTAYFRKIDERRKIQDIKSLLPLRKFEKKEIVPASSLKLVTEEKSKLVKGLVFWIVRAFVGAVMFFVDYILYRILKIISDNGEINIKQEGYSVLEIFVNGTGPVSDNVRDMVSGLNYTYSSNESISNAVCLPQPTVIPEEITNRILALYGMQMALILFEAYGLRSRRLIASFFYRKREKKRILFRYNDMLKRRFTYLQRARHQIRRKAAMQKLEVGQTKGSKVTIRKNYRQVKHRLAYKEDNNTAGLQTKSSFLPCLKKYHCLICEVNLNPDNEIKCLHSECGLAYCKECWGDIKGLCLACTHSDDLDRVLSELTILSDSGQAANQ